MLNLLGVLVCLISLVQSQTKVERFLMQVSIFGFEVGSPVTGSGFPHQCYSRRLNLKSSTAKQFFVGIVKLHLFECDNWPTIFEYKSIRLIVGTPGFNSFVESDQKI